MPKIFKEHYTTFQRHILAVFMSEEELNKLDKDYNIAKYVKCKKEYEKIMNTPKGIK